MTRHDILCGKILVLSAVAFMGMTSIALADDALSPVQQGNVTYITGGIGTDERDQLEAAKGDYNLHVTSSRDGAFADATTLVIADKKGTELVNTTAGPIFYAALPTGTYTLTASHHEQQQTRTVKATKGKSTNVNLIWK